MAQPSDTITPYNADAARFAAQYESLPPAAMHAAYIDLVPAPRDETALEVGAGSGRGAAWLASLGYTVTAEEPARGMRAEGQRRDTEPAIRWVDDRLPGLTQEHRLCVSYDFILLSAVWMHVQPVDRARAIRKLTTLLKPGGVMVVTLRDGPSDAGRPMWPTPEGEMEALARDHGLGILRITESQVQLGRTDVRWRFNGGRAG